MPDYTERPPYTLREHLAWTAMETLLEENVRRHTMREIARDAVELANAIMDELKRTAPHDPDA
jgi:hypothetical protein